MSVDVAEIARLLEEARGAHAQYRQALATMHTETLEAALQVAYQARCRAEELDPTRSSAAWAGDVNALGLRIPHRETLEFLQQELKKIRG